MPSWLYVIFVRAKAWEVKVVQVYTACDGNRIVATNFSDESEQAIEARLSALLGADQAVSLVSAL